MYIEKKESDTGFEYSIRKTLFKKIFEWILVTVIFLLAFGIMALITYNYDKGLFAIFCIGIGIFWAVILFQISNTSSLIIDNDGKLIKINDLQITRDFEDMLILRRVISIDQSQSHKPSSGGRNNAAYKQKWQIQYRNKDQDYVIFHRTGEYHPVYTEYIEELSTLLKIPIIDATGNKEILTQSSDRDKNLITKLTESTKNDRSTEKNDDYKTMKVMNPELRNLDLKKLDNGFEIKTENPYLWSIKRLPFFGFIGFLLFALFLIWFGISILTSVGNLISSWEEGVFVYLIVGFVSLLPLLIGALILLVFIRQIFYTKIIDIVKLEKDSIKLKRKFRFITSSIGSIKTVKLEMIRVINFDKYKSALEFISDENRVIFFENMPSRKINSIKNYLEKLLVSM